MRPNAGLVLPGEHTLARVLAPLAAELAECWWVVDIQSGTFSQRWLGETSENEAVADALVWDLPEIANTSATGLRPGTLPRLADALGLDEWSFYFAMAGPEAAARPRAASLARARQYMSVGVLDHLDRYTDLFACHVDGWWEFYSPRPNWLHLIQQAFPAAVGRPTHLCGRPPVAR